MPDAIEIEGMRLSAPQPAELCYICGDAAFYYDEDSPLCSWHYGTRKEQQIEQRPLLAQCAALLDSLLGGPVVGNGIIDEIRRVRAELAREGW